MNTITMKLHSLIYLLRQGNFSEIIRKVRRKIYSNTRSFCLRRDLTQPWKAPDAKIPITVRPLAERDISVFFHADASSSSDEGMRERSARRLLLNAGIPTCYVAVTSDDTPCYMQWLMGAGHNDQIQSFFSGTFPRLAQDEALLEDAFTVEDHRGKGIMACAMAQVIEKAADMGVRGVITFVHEDNIPSLKGCKRAGFVPYMIRKERWRFFCHQVTFTPLPSNTPYSFDQEPADNILEKPVAGALQNPGFVYNFQLFRQDGRQVIASLFLAGAKGVQQFLAMFF